MILVMYNAEQDAIRLYLCEYECWNDMLDIYVSYEVSSISLHKLISWGWELVGDL
jgi:hypothetical protein